MDLEPSQEPDPDLLEAGGHSEDCMEQPPKQEGTISAPSSGESIPQLLQDRIPGGSEEAVSRDGIPGGSEEAVGRDGIPGGSEEAVGRDGIPGGSEEAVGRDGIPGGSEEAVGREGIPGGSEEAVGREGIPGGSEEAVGRDGIPGGSEEAVGRDGIPGGSEEAVGRDGIPGGSEEAVGRDGIPGGSEEAVGRDGIPPGSQEAVGRDGIPPGSQEAVGRDGIPPGSQEAAVGDGTAAASWGSTAPDGQTAMPCGGAKEVPLPCPPSEHPRGDAEEKQPSEAGGSVEGTPVPSLAAGAVGLAAECLQKCSPGREAEEDFYCVKWIRWKGERTPVITQSQNGPCPLLAIMNILFLQWKVKLPPQKEVITAEELMAHLGDCILATQPREPSEGLQLNFQQNINDTMMVLPKLSTGLDVNVRFTGVSDFEYTPECIIFDLLNVPLYHGWLVDPQTPEVVQAVGKLSYNQLVEKIITCKHATDSSLVSEGLVAEQFLESTASQLTFHGLCELAAAVREGELSVFFRNNHFSTMTKHKGHLYLLVTDQGFLHEEGVVWESLHTVDGDSCFCDTDFHLSHAPGKEGATAGTPEQSQVDQDYMMALSLQQQQGQDPSALSDLELARQLQQEEYQQQQPQPPPPHPQQQVSMQARGRGERRQRQRPDLDCTLL